MTPRELVDFVKETCNYGNIDNVDSTDRPTVQILLRANMNMHLILQEHDFRWSYVLLSIAISQGGGQTYALPSNVRKILLLRIGDDVLTKRHPKDLFLRHFDDDARENLPVQYIDGVLSSGNIQVTFYPTFTGSGTVSGIGFLRATEIVAGDLTATTQIPVFPRDTHHVIAWMTVADIWDLRGKGDEAASATKMAAGLLASIINNDKEHPEITPKILQSARILRVRRKRTRGSMNVYG